MAVTQLRGGFLLLARQAKNAYAPLQTWASGEVVSRRSPKPSSKVRFLPRLPAPFCISIKDLSIMKTIGLLGGMSYVSTIEYYRYINQKVHEKLGKKHSAKIIVNSVDYQELKKFDYKDWEKAGEVLLSEIMRLDRCGVDCILICNGTQHKAFDLIESALQIKTPIFHIVDCVGEYAAAKKFKKLLLLATQFTMEDTFYSGRLQTKFGMNTVIPSEADRTEIQRIIQEELVKERFIESSKQKIVDIISKHSCDAVILGCTELPLLIQQKDCPTPLLNTVEIQCDKAINFSFEAN
jgi:aspartate racemase